MRKIFTLVLILLSTFSITTQAQTNLCNLTVNYSSVAETTNPFIIHFTNLSTPLATTDSITWNFGDGTSSHDVNPVHTYANAATYQVCLIVKKITSATGTTPCIAYYCHAVVVTAPVVPCTLTVNYSSVPSTTNPLMVNFTNQATPLATTDSITWNFGDGISSHDVNPVHTYATAGTYQVCLIVKKNITVAGAPVCQAYSCHAVVVTAPVVPCTLTVNYSSVPSTANPLMVNFTNLATPLSPTDSVTWTFGDGTTSNSVNPVHTYATAGTYQVCLKVKKNSTVAGAPVCQAYYCHAVVVTAPVVPCTLTVNYSSVPSTSNPLIINFTNLATPLAATDSVTWNFGDGSSSHDVNPVHTYATAGTYQVCLIVKKNSNVIGTPVCQAYSCHAVVVTAPVVPCTLTVNYTSVPSTSNSLIINFTNLATPLAATDSVTWSFGDGSSSHDVNPVHTYANAGTYQVCLIVKKFPNSGSNTPCVAYSCHSLIVVAPCNFQPYFNSSVDSLNAQHIYFTNQTTGLTVTNITATWSFGDGTSSTTWNPNHTYATAGTYHVCLVIRRDSNCVREFCRDIIVISNVPPCTLVASFNSSPDSVTSNNIHFQNTSTPVTTIDSIRWTFGDGTTSNQLNPSHIYSAAGTYNVCLRIQKRYNAGGVFSNCVSEICHTITVVLPCNYQPYFSSSVDSLNIHHIIFTNQTIGATTSSITATWSFGDGTTATTWNANHTYATAGTYHVCLVIRRDSNCVREFCRDIVVLNPLPPTPPCNNQSDFTAVKFSTDNQSYTFTPAYQNSALQYTWTFGDGTGSLSMLTTHHYATAGDYTACLTAWRNASCASTTCKTLNVQAQINCTNATLNYTYTRDAIILNKYYFTANSNVTISSQVWTIVKLSNNSTTIITLNNPSYIFTDTGYYRVCLKATLANGCVKEYCDNIHILQVNPTTCQLQAYPNPANTVVNVNVYLAAPSTITANVYNSNNILVKTVIQAGAIGNNIVAISIGDLPTGTYMIRLMYGGLACYATFIKV